MSVTIGVGADRVETDQRMDIQMEMVRAIHLLKMTISEEGKIQVL